MRRSPLSSPRLAARCSAHQGDALAGARMGYETDLKLFIDGVLEIAAKAATPTPSSTRSPAAASPKCPTPPRPTSTRRSPPPSAPGPNGARPTSRSAARSCTRPPTLLRERADHIGAILTQEQGKILAEAKAEVLGSAQLFDWYAEEIKRDYGRTLVRPAGQLSRVIRQPVGPIATFTPVEFPDLSAGQEGRRRARRRLHGDLAPAARNAGLRRPSCSARWPTPASPRASPSWSTATPT